MKSTERELIKREKIATALVGLLILAAAIVVCDALPALRNVVIGVVFALGYIACSTHRNRVLTIRAIYFRKHMQRWINGAK